MPAANWCRYPSRVRAVGVVRASARASGSHEVVQERGLGCSMRSTWSWGEVSTTSIRTIKPV